MHDLTTTHNDSYIFKKKTSKNMARTIVKKLKGYFGQIHFKWGLSGLAK